VKGDREARSRTVKDRATDKSWWTLHCQCRCRCCCASIVGADVTDALSARRPLKSPSFTAVAAAIHQFSASDPFTGTLLDTHGQPVIWRAVRWPAWLAIQYTQCVISHNDNASSRRPRTRILRILKILEITNF